MDGRIDLLLPNSNLKEPNVNNAMTATACLVAGSFSVKTSVEIPM